MVGVRVVVGGGGNHQAPSWSSGVCLGQLTHTHREARGDIKAGWGCI